MAELFIDSFQKINKKHIKKSLKDIGVEEISNKASIQIASLEVCLKLYQIVGKQIPEAPYNLLSQDSNIER